MSVDFIELMVLNDLLLYHLRRKHNFRMTFAEKIIKATKLDFYLIDVCERGRKVHES